MRLVNGIFCILLVLFAAVQYNDPDGLYWAAIYGIAALWAGVAALRPALFSRSAISGLFVVCLAAALFGVYWHWPDTPEWWRRDVWWETETAREGMGVMIVAFAMLMASVVALGRPRA